MAGEDACQGSPRKSRTPVKPYNFSFDDLVHVTHEENFRTILQDPVTGKCVFRGSRKCGWRWKDRASVWGEIRFALSKLHLLWMSPMPKEPIDADPEAAVLAKERDRDPLEFTRIVQAKGGRSRYGEFLLRSHKSRIFEAYRQQFGEFAVYRIPPEKYSAEVTDTYLVCPKTTSIPLPEVSLDSLQVLKVPTAFTFVPYKTGEKKSENHTWTNIQFCFAIEEGTTFEVNDMQVGFLTHECKFDWNNFDVVPICIPNKDDLGKCSNLLAHEAHHKYVLFLQEHQSPQDSPPKRSREVKTGVPTAPCPNWRNNGVWCEQDCKLEHKFARVRPNCRQFHAKLHAKLLFIPDVFSQDHDEVLQDSDETSQDLNETSQGGDETSEDEDETPEDEDEIAAECSKGLSCSFRHREPRWPDYSKMECLPVPEATPEKKKRLVSALSRLSDESSSGDDGKLGDAYGTSAALPPTPAKIASAVSSPSQVGATSSSSRKRPIDNSLGLISSSFRQRKARREDEDRKRKKPRIE